MLKTYLHDRELPALPVPDLETTCSRIESMIAPLVDAETLAATSAALAEFKDPAGKGPALQKALLEFRDTLPDNASWLRPFWDDMYTSWRGRLPLDMNYAFRFNTERWGGERTLARLVRALASVFRQLAAGDLPPEQSKAGYLSMDQAAKVLYTRISARGNDTLMPVKLEGQENIAVVCGGHWFTLPLLRPDGSSRSEESLIAAFKSIRAEAALLDPAPCLGAATAVPGEDRSQLRARLQQSLQNRLSLKALESAPFVVCLDDAHSGDEDMMRRLLAGSAGNRWFTKSLQIIATENGGLGANFEHAGCDAAIWVYLLNHADTAILENANSSIDEVSPGDEAAVAAEDAALAHAGTVEGDSPYRRLLWNVDADLLHSLAEAETAFEQQGTAMQLVCREYPELSREALKALKTSPDAFLQLAFQAAQYRIFGKLHSSYEAVSVRGFAFGRTECARASTSDALAFAQALDSGSDADCLALYRAAEKAHLGQLLQCQRGTGAERHMYGLSAMYKLFGSSLDMDVTPTIFDDPGWLALKHDTLSTSGIGAPFIQYFGFGPVVEDGVGLGYAPSKDGTGLTITSNKGKKTSLAVKFAESFAHTVHRMIAILSNPQALPDDRVL